jgi:HlyD family secretion protein
MSNPWVKRVGILLAVVIVAVVGWRFLSHGKVAKVSYELADVDKGTVEKSISSTGSVAALVTVDVGSQISGQISELKADFNTQVKKGDLLAVIDPQTYQQRMNSAQADLSVAYAGLGTQQANLRKAQTTLDQNRRDYDRSKQLAESKLISQSALEDSRKAVALSESDLAIAEAQIKNAEASVQTRKASLEQARIDLSRTQIRSPIDGVVIQRSIDLGQTVAASLQAPVLFKIAQDLSQIRIEAKVDEADIGSIKQEDPATFTVDAFPEQTFNGRVAQVRLASTTVQNVVTYSVMIQANNPRQMLIPGMTANVRIVTARRENVLRVPNDAARFQPPEARAATANNGPAGGFPGGGGGGGGAGGGGFQGGGFNNDLVKELGLTDDQQKKLDKARQELFAQIRTQQGGNSPAGLGGGGGGGGGGFGGGGFNNGQQQAVRNRFDNMMASVLTPAQLEKFRALRTQRGGQAQSRRGTLWTLEAGAPKAHEVRLGVADDRYTEIVEGDLKEAAKVIVRARTEVAK